MNNNEAFFDSFLSLDDFKKLNSLTGASREAFIEEKKQELLVKTPKKNYWQSLIEEVNKVEKNLLSEKYGLQEEINGVNKKISEYKQADDFFKKYQENILGGIASSLPEKSGELCAELNDVIKQSLQNSTTDISSQVENLQKKYDKRNFISKMFNKKQNKKIDESFGKVVTFFKENAEYIKSNPEVIQRFCDVEQFKKGKEDSIKKQDNLNDKLQRMDKILDMKAAEKQKIYSDIERVVNQDIEKINISTPQLDVSTYDGRNIVIEDEANIENCASFDMNFQDLKTAQKAAKLISTSFAITDNPNEAKNTQSFYLKGTEIVTPFIAKEDLPKYRQLLAMLKENNADPINLNIPTRPENILRDQPLNKDKVDVAGFVSYAAQYGVSAERESGLSTEKIIEQKYNNKNFLYRGTMTADPNYAGSVRNGRQGILYATDSVVNAAGYSGSKSQMGAGLSGTGDKYTNNAVTYMKDGKPTVGYIGFIHVYQNQDNKFYRNFGIEDKNNNWGEEHYETFLKSDNKHVATYLTISSENGCKVDKVFEIPLNDKNWQAFIEAHGINPELTYQNDRAELFERMKVSLNEYEKNGKLSTLSFAKVKDNPEYQQPAPKQQLNKTQSGNISPTPEMMAQAANVVTPPPPPTPEMMAQAANTATPPPPPTPEMMAQAANTATPPPPPTPEMMTQAANVVTPPPPPTPEMMAQAANAVTPPPPPTPEMMAQAANAVTPPPPPTPEMMAQAANVVTPPPPPTPEMMAQAANVVTPPPPPTPEMMAQAANASAKSFSEMTQDEKRKFITNSLRKGVNPYLQTTVNKSQKTQSNNLSKNVDRAFLAQKKLGRA